MRLWVTLISAQMWVAVASAETLPDKVVSLMNDICVAPASSDEKMVVGKQIYFSLNQFSNNGQPKTLVFTDFVYPNDKIWDAIASSTQCPNQ